MKLGQRKAFAYESIITYGVLGCPHFTMDFNKWLLGYHQHWCRHPASGFI